MSRQAGVHCNFCLVVPSDNVGGSVYVSCLNAMMRDWDQEMLRHEQVGSWMVVNMWWYERGGSYPVTLVWRYERVGSYVPCSHLRDAACEEVRSWWITCVGLRAGRSVEQDYERGGSYSRTTSGEVRRGKTTSRQVRVSNINPKSKANYLCVVKVEKFWGLRSWSRTN